VLFLNFVNYGKAAPYIGNISAQKLFHSNADSHVNVRIAMENLFGKKLTNKGRSLTKNKSINHLS
jgi:hypothetical protein